MQLAERGGPRSVDWADVREFQRMMEDEPDAAESLVVKVGKPGLSAKMFNLLVRSLALMAYQPGGVDFMDRHFEAKGVVGEHIQS
jgi:hypothetical protein